MTGSSLLDLPDELLWNVLHMDLEYADLVTCGQLCHRLRNMMQAPALQYLLALKAAWLVDGPSKNWSVEEKLAMLRRYTQSWKTADWADRSVVYFESDDEYEIGNIRYEEGGTVLEKIRREDGTMWVTYDRFACPNRGIQRSTFVWQKQDSPAASHKMLSLSQHLFVRAVADVEAIWDDEATWERTLSFLDLFTGKPHPEHHPGPPLRVPQWPGSSAKCEGPYIGILPYTRVSGDRQGKHVVVFNWKTGASNRWYDPDLEGFAFVGEQYLMLLCSHYTGRSAVTLRFFDLESRAVKPDLVLDLPLFQVGSTIFSLAVSYSPPPLDADTDAFHLNPLARIYIVQLAALPPDEEGTEVENFAFLVPAYNFMKRLRDQSRTSDRLTWDSWGPSDTRALLFDLPMLSGDLSTIHCAGLRFAHIDSEGCIRMYDLNTLRSSRSIPGVLTSEVFVDDVRTHLPCRTALIDVGGNNYFALGEDYLALLMSTPELNSYEVTVFAA